MDEHFADLFARYETLSRPSHADFADRGARFPEREWRAGPKPRARAFGG
jgi:hypothetical protein